MHFLNHIIAALLFAATDCHRLALEKVALKQQLIVLKRGKKLATLEDSDRVFRTLLSRMIKVWAEHCCPRGPIHDFVATTRRV